MVEVCYVCGDRGFSNALLACSECCVASAHQYCLGIPPGSIDDTFDWVCECCSVPMEFESCQFGGVFSLGSNLQTCSGDLKIQSRSEIVSLPDEPIPLCMVSPIQYHGSATRRETSNLSQKHRTSFMENPVSIKQGIILLVSPSGKIFIEKEESYESLGNSKENHELIKPSMKFDSETELCYSMKFDSETELSFVTALPAQPRKSLRNQVVAMLQSAGWTVEYKPRINQSGKNADRVYVSPQGKFYWSLPRAYHKLERDFRKAKAKKSKVSNGSGNSNF